MKESIIYKILIPINKIFMSMYCVEYINKEYIPKTNSIILAGNHTSYLDPLLLISSTNRCIHFLAKIELFKGIKKYFFNAVGVIPVDRTKKNPEAIKKANKILSNKLVVGIFPEGTINKTKNTILPFKKGAVKMAYDTNSEIIPFSITGKYCLFRKSVKICFGKPYKVSGNIEEDNKILEEKIITLIRSNQ